MKQVFRRICRDNESLRCLDVFVLTDDDRSHCLALAHAHGVAGINRMKRDQRKHESWSVSEKIHKKAQLVRGCISHNLSTEKFSSMMMRKSTVAALSILVAVAIAHPYAEWNNARYRWNDLFAARDEEVDAPSQATVEPMSCATVTYKETKNAKSHRVLVCPGMAVSL